MSQHRSLHLRRAAVRALEIDGEPWFVGKDVAETLGYANAADAITTHCKGVAKRYPLQTPGGRQEVRVLSEPDVLRLIVNSTLPAAERFERWVFEEVLPTIRKTGAYAAPGAALSPLKLTAEAAKAFPSLGARRAPAGLRQERRRHRRQPGGLCLTQINLMKQLGHTHLEAEQQDSQWYTPTELGKLIGTSARGVNLLLAEAGLQLKLGEKWEATDAGRDFTRLFDTGKKHGTGVPVMQLKWSRNVLPMLGESKEAA